MLKEGVSSLELDGIAEEIIRQAGAEPSFKGYRGYPASLCVEVNDVVVHGIPRADEIIREGDVVGLDVGAYREGFHGDTATTVAVGEVSAEATRLMVAAREALRAGIQKAVAGGLVRDISQAIQGHVESCGFSCVRALVGHGIGRKMHEGLQVPNFHEPGQFPDYEVRLRPGMTLAIEPMVNAGGPDVRMEDDGWTVRTADGSLSVHYEHTVAIGKDGTVALTELEGLCTA